MIVLNSILNPEMAVLFIELFGGMYLCAAKGSPQRGVLLGLTNMRFIGSGLQKFGGNLFFPLLGKNNDFAL